MVSQNGKQLLARRAGVVGDDDVVAVHGAHQIADHAVLVHRRLVGIEMLRPFREPRLLHRRDLLLQRGERVAAAGGALLLLDLGDQRFDDEGGVADHRQTGAAFLVDVARIVGGVDDGLAGRHVGTEIGFGQARADRHHHVGLAHELGEHLGARAGRAAERERMRVRDRALARIGRDHRRGDKLGQRREQIAGFGVVDALARPQHRVLGGEQHARGFLDRVGIGRGALHRHRDVVDLALELGLEDLVRHLDHHRAALAAAHRLIGAPHQVGQLLHVVRQRRPFGHRTVDVGGAERRLDVLLRQRQPGRDHQHRHVLGVGLRDARETRSRCRGRPAPRTRRSSCRA